MKTAKNYVQEVQEAQELANKLNLSMEVNFLKNDFHFDDDKEKRDIYIITLKKGSRKYSFNFGQSINCSGEYIVKENLKNKIWVNVNTKGKIHFTKDEFKKLSNYANYVVREGIIQNPNFEIPNIYDVLCCLQKYDVGSFEDFCGDYGHNTDSRKAEKIYKSVLEEWKNVQSLFNDEELSQLQEIQ